jgi:hypothetical protein
MRGVGLAWHGNDAPAARLAGEIFVFFHAQN